MESFKKIIRQLLFLRNHLNGNGGNVLLTTLVEPSSTSLNYYNQEQFSPELVHPARLSLQDACNYILDTLHELHCNFLSLKRSGTPHCLIDLHEECLTTHALDITTSTQPCYN